MLVFIPNSFSVNVLLVWAVWEMKIDTELFSQFQCSRTDIPPPAWSTIEPQCCTRNRRMFSEQIKISEDHCFHFPFHEYSFHRKDSIFIWFNSKVWIMFSPHIKSYAVICGFSSEINFNRKIVDWQFDATLTCILFIFNHFFV